MQATSDLAEVGTLLEEAFAGGACIWLALNPNGKIDGKIEGTITPEMRARLKLEGPKVRRWLRWNLTDTGRRISGDKAAWIASGEAAGFWTPSPEEIGATA